MASSAKRCHYEVLGLPRDCTPDEIRSAYRRLALQRHPDKLVQSGISQSEATAQFQELQQAYEVLSDPKERAWYDSHRSQILFSDPDSLGKNSVVPDLFSFFSNTVYSGYSDSGRGFYKVYSDVFDKIHANEINFAKKMGIGVDAVRQAPVMGNLDSPYEQVTAFYGYCDHLGEADYGVGDLDGRFRDGLNVAEGEDRNGDEVNDDGDDFFCAPHADGEEVDVSVDFDDVDEDDDENGFLEAMVAGHKNRKPSASTHKPKASVTPTQIEHENDEVNPMEYNNRKSSRKKRGAKKEKGRRNWEESNEAAVNGNCENMNSNRNDNSFGEESTSQHFVENEGNGKENEQVDRDNKSSNQPADKKGNSKDTKTKAKISSKGRKGKVASNNLGNTCGTCGEEFESSNVAFLE
ncbi:DnaJ domain containing protein [Sesbania bispinosa]|nr:DnaJ domain containing protein [Sesbania bispinosa]